jgi:D-arabinose 1-dehydrogenase-like Zn-dependent alcohol dehydrogenase
MALPLPTGFQHKYKKEWHSTPTVRPFIYCQPIMVKKIHAVATITSFTFKEITVEVPDLKPFEVYIKIKACGVCYTDIYALGIKDVVAGHETIGEITEVGSLVTYLKVGDLVGYE